MKWLLVCILLPFCIYGQTPSDTLTFLDSLKLDEQLDHVPESVRLRQDTLRSSLIDLPWSAEEIRSINELVDGELFIDRAATEKAFKENAHKYGIIHLATHALIDDEHPMYSKLVFAPDEESGEDGFLNTYELYNLNLNAQMAVLSACNTGYGRMVRGEGIMSLARGFIYAGCPSVIMSLWPVPDKTTSEIMSEFYRQLAKGLPKDEALRQAKLIFLENADEVTSNPFYWAGFVAIGDPSPLKLAENKSPIWPWAGGGAALLLIAGLVFYRRKKNTSA